MALANRDIGLGTVFTGKVDDSFKQTVQKLRDLIKDLNTVQAKAKAAKSAGTGPMYGEFSEAALAMGRMTNESKQMQKAFNEMIPVYGDTGTKISRLEATIRNGERAIVNYGNAMIANGRAGKEWVETADRQAIATKAMQGEISVAGGKFKSLTASGKEYLSGIGVMEAETRKVAAAAKKTGEAVGFMGGRMGWTSGVADRLTRAFKVIAAYGSVAAAITLVTSSIRRAGQEMTQFDQNLKAVQAITGATANEMGVMSDILKEVASTTKMSTQDTAKGMILLGQAGLSASETISAIRATTTLAIGSMSDMDTTADLLTTTLMAFNLNAVESSRVADIMANAMNKSKLDIQKLRVAFSYVAASAAEAGMGIEETAASMMVLANNGLRASTIGTGLRQVLAKLISPSQKLREAYESYSIDLDKISPATAGWTMALKNLTAILWDHKKGVVDMGKAYELFQLRGAQSAAILVKSFKNKDYQKMLDYTYEIGAAQAMADKQAEGLGYKLQRLGNRIALVAVNIGESGLVAAFKLLIDAIGATVGAINTFLQTTGGQMTVQIIGLTAVVFGLVVGIKALGAAIIAWTVGTKAVSFYVTSLALGATRMAAALGAAKIILGGFANPILGIVVAISAAAVALYRFGTANKRLIESTGEEAVKLDAVTTSLEAYSGAFKSLHERMARGDNVWAEYSAMLKRLMTDHKDLAPIIDITRMKSEGFRQELENAMKTQAAFNAKKGLETRTINLVAQQKEIGLIEDELSRKDDLRISNEEAAGMSKELTTLTNQANISVSELTMAYLSYQKNVGITNGNLLALVTTTTQAKEGNEALAATIRDKLIKYWADLAKEEDAVVTAMKGMSPAFKKVFEALDPEEQSKFLTGWKTLDERISAIKKKWKASADEPDRAKKEAAAIEAENLKFLAEQTEKHRKDELDQLKNFYVVSQNMAETSYGEVTRHADESFQRRLGMIQFLSRDENEAMTLTASATRTHYVVLQQFAERALKDRLDLLKEEYDANALYIKDTFRDGLKGKEQLRELNQKYAGDQRKALEATYQVYKTISGQILEEEKRLQGEIKSLKEKRLDDEREFQKILREIRYIGYSDSDIFVLEANRAKLLLESAQEAINAGDYKEAERLAKESFDLFLGFTKAAKANVKDIEDVGENAAAQRANLEYFAQGLIDARNLLDQVNTSKQGEPQGQLVSTTRRAKDIDSVLVGIINRIKELDTTQLTLVPDPALSALDLVISKVDTLRDKLLRLGSLAATVFTQAAMAAASVGTPAPIGIPEDADYYPEYQTGTGLRGVPHTGLYKLHEGEIVKNPAESDAERRGESMFSGVLHTINLNINGTSHKLFGEEGDIKRLVRTLKREQLVTA